MFRYAWFWLKLKNFMTIVLTNFIEQIWSYEKTRHT